MQKELVISNINKAEYSINIAVSWLTDKDIIYALIEKAKENIRIKILLSNSNWNLIRFEQYKVLSSLGVGLFKKGEQESGKGNFMHCKFCIIDEKILLHGSYNWTTLGNTNDENLDITEDYEKARNFTKEFFVLLQDSENFNFDLENLNEIINKYQEMENNNIEPDDDLKTIINLPDFKEGESILPIRKEFTSKIVKIEQLEEYDFKQIKKLEFHGRLKLVGYRWIDCFESSISFSSDSTKVTKSYSFYVNNSTLYEGLLRSDEQIRTFHSRLGGFPDVLLSFILNYRTISLTADIEFDEAKEGYFLCKTNANKFLIEFSGFWPSSDLKGDARKMAAIGYRYFWDVIDGKVTREDIEKQFRKINWLD